jgi:hypothetical protein
MLQLREEIVEKDMARYKADETYFSHDFLRFADSISVDLLGILICEEFGIPLGKTIPDRSLGCSRGILLDYGIVTLIDSVNLRCEKFTCRSNR